MAADASVALEGDVAAFVDSQAVVLVVDGAMRENMSGWRSMLRTIPTCPG